MPITGTAFLPAGGQGQRGGSREGDADDFLKLFHDLISLKLFYVVKWAAVCAPPSFRK
jgi:hypothetical protein